jgi:hypothetical protein
VVTERLVEVKAEQRIVPFEFLFRNLRELLTFVLLDYVTLTLMQRKRPVRFSKPHRSNIVSNIKYILKSLSGLIYARLILEKVKIRLNHFRY